MSQEYHTGKGKGVPLKYDEEFGTHPRQQSGRPHYVTVGSGSISEGAARLQALLDTDDLTRDMPTPAHVPVPRHEINEAADNERKLQASATYQLSYNKHRASLARSVNRVVETLKSLQQKNASLPATYPSVQRVEAASTHLPTRLNPRPRLAHTQTTFSGASMIDSASRPGQMPQSQISIGESSTEGESNRTEQSRVLAEPRLITPQIAHEFSILKLDLKLGALHQTELVHSLEKGSIASLLDSKISSTIKHLLSLRERIEDSSSKVLVTGDLNTGKSTFCNALLRRKILPEDQQPCTSIFCEVLDASENGGIEEVHAVHKEVVYNRYDESTYDIFRLVDLEKMVTDNRTYTQCKVYIIDVRTNDQSLLNNGVVDISIIDAPGLNSDTTQTTAVFARQEEIDVVVFVVSAANHFTQTAKEFIWAAAAEKAHIFMVVNGYDLVRDKERCQTTIFEQLYGLSPRTLKESNNLVHFVSSNAILSSGPSPPRGDAWGGSGSASVSGGDGPDFDPSDPKGKDKEKIRDFEQLEQSLRRFVIGKRAHSKLAPAKTYLLNVLSDIYALASVNLEVIQSELDRVSKELADLEPVLKHVRKQKQMLVTISMQLSRQPARESTTTHGLLSLLLCQMLLWMTFMYHIPVCLCLFNMRII